MTEVRGFVELPSRGDLLETEASRIRCEHLENSQSPPSDGQKFVSSTEQI
jgi:hypothetical protein